MLDLLCSQPQRLEAGLVTLDRNLILDEGARIDILARDVAGLPVVLLSCGPDLAEAIGRTAAVLAAFHRGRFLLDRLYCHAGLDAYRRPRFILLSRRFVGSRAVDMIQLVGGCDVSVMEFQIVKTLDGRSELHLVMLARSSTATPTAEVAVTREGVVEPAVVPELSGSGIGQRMSAESPGATRPAPEVEAGSSHDGRTSALDDRPATAPLADGRSAPSSPAVPLQLVPAEDRPIANAPPEELLESDRGVFVDAPVQVPQTTSGDGSTGAGEDWSVPVLDDVDLLVRAKATPECRRLCLNARDSIRSLSSQVTQTTESDRICFLVEDAPLATLIPRGDSLQLRVGEEGGPAFEVCDDEAFNASLNATFSHYFSRFAVRA